MRRACFQHTSGGVPGVCGARTWELRGDAAEAFATLVERLESGEDYRDVPGIVYRDDGEVVVSEGRFRVGLS